MNNPLLSFLQEIFTRLSSKSPKFFKLFQWVTAIVTAVTGLPDFLKLFNITLPSPLDAFANTTVAIAGSLAFFFSKLPVENPTIAVTADGAVVKKTDQNKLPFTAKSEANQALKEGKAGSSTLKEVMNTALRLIILFMLIGIGTHGHAQSFFKAVPKNMQSTKSLEFESAPIVPSTMTAFRPVFNAVSYTIPDNVAQAGFGISYQWLKQDPTTQVWASTFAINGLFYGGAQLGEQQQGVYAAGISIGFFNNLLAPGVDYNFVLRKPQFTLSANINFNNK